MISKIDSYIGEYSRQVAVDATGTEIDCAGAMTSIFNAGSNNVYFDFDNNISAVGSVNTSVNGFLPPNFGLTISNKIFVKCATGLTSTLVVIKYS